VVALGDPVRVRVEEEVPCGGMWDKDKVERE
jgi:hypothetical protein